MPGFLKATVIVLSSGAIVGTGALEFMPEHTRPLLALFARAIPDFDPLPCHQQSWLNADRVCQTWTVPHREVKRILNPEPPQMAERSRAPTEAAAEMSRGAAEAWAIVGPEAGTADQADGKASSARSAHNGTPSRASAAPSRGVDTRRVITSRTTMESSL